MGDKHTPGSWEVLKGPEWGGFTVSGQRLIATMNDWGFEDEAEANARLIAAAPAMLNALISVLQAHDYDGALTMGSASLSPAIRSMVAHTIEKATGQ